jgi:hypothetical protein
MKGSFLKKGQSLVELSIFASVVLVAMATMVSYALNYTHNQRVSMLAFRKGMQKAAQGASSYRQASVVLVYDKAIADLTSIWGIGRKAAISASGSGVQSFDLYAEMEGSDSELPRITYVINGKEYTMKTAALVSPTPRSGPRSKSGIPGWGGSGKSWYWEYPDEGENPFKKGTSWDVDNDGLEEVMMGGYIDEKGRQVGDPAETVIDFQRGEIDMSEKDASERQGLLPDTKTTVINLSSLANTQDGRRLRTATRLNTAEIIERRIKLNPQMSGGLSHIQHMIDANNNDCYGRGSPCAEDERDYLLTENGQRYIVVRSKFTTNENKYLWEREN